MTQSTHSETDSKHSTKETLCDLEEHLQEYSKQLIETVKQNPLSSLLVAGSLGFILSSLLRK